MGLIGIDSRERPNAAHVEHYKSESPKMGWPSKWNFEIIIALTLWVENTLGSLQIVHLLKVFPNF